MQELLESVRTLSPEERQALAVLLRRQGINLYALTPIERANTSSHVQVSYAQQRQWVLWQLEPQSCAYNIPSALGLQGALDIPALRQSFEALQQRHEVLRTTFEQEGEHAMQVIHAAAPFELPLDSLPHGQTVEQYVQSQARLPFDLERGPLLRASLLRLAEDDHVLVLTVHHVVSDGWSTPIMVEELVRFYEAFSTGSEANLPPLPIQYADYAVWQRQWMEAGEQARQLAYWQAQLGSEQPVLALPMDRARPAVRSNQGAKVGFDLAPSLVRDLNSLAQQQGVTLFMLLLASFQTLLHRYSRQDDIRVGVPVANRNRVETERLIGFFVNTQVLKAEFDSAITFVGLLQQVRQTALDAQAHQDLPFEQLVEALQPERSLSHSPLFQVLYNHQTQVAQLGRQVSGLKVRGLEWEGGTSQFDLALGTIEHQDGIAATLTYALDLFDADTVQRMAHHWQRLLQAIVQDPGKRVAELALLAPDEHQRIIADWNPEGAHYSAHLCLHQLIEAQAAHAPEATALVCNDQRLSYAWLNQRANRLAHRLRAQGVGPDVRVGLAVERGLDMVIGLLAILKAGGAYVPIDPHYPTDRLSYMISDSGVSLLLTQSHLMTVLPLPEGVQAWMLDEEPAERGGQHDDNLPNLTHPDNLAYVIYTSGSTGKPKGTLLTHRNVVRLFEATQGWFEFGAEDVWTVFHSYAFDFSVWELFGALLHGGCAVIVPADIARSPTDFHALLVRERVTVLNQTPSAFNPLVAVATDHSTPPAPLALRYVVFGGEALDVGRLRPWFERFGDRQPRLINMYGITETTVHVTYRPVGIEDLGEQAASPIGRVIPDLSWYLLDGDLNVVAPGCSGELHVGQDGLARGYHERAALTALRFVPNPYDTSAQGGGRLYRSGDLARYRAQGVIEYAGRIDHQVKIRGFRIELGEIQDRLQRCVGVCDAVVLDVDGQAGKQLAAYLVLDAQARAHDPSTLRMQMREHLKAELPDYMVPTHLLFVEALPLTANGKLDRKALPAPDISQQQQAYVAPRTALEQRIAAIWADVLKVEQVGLQDNFFELGGDSIISIQVVSRARHAGIRFTPKELFQHQTVQGLAGIAREGELGGLQVDQGQASGEAVLVPIQQHFFEQSMPERHHWNQSLLLVPGNILQPLWLEQALHAVVIQHDALRLSFTHARDQGWVARYHGVGQEPTPLLWTAAPTDTLALEAVCDEAQASLNLAEGPLLRAVLASLPDGSQRLLLAIHHLVVDGVSWRILLEDLQTAYGQVAAGQPVQLPAKTSSTQAWAQRLQAYAYSPVQCQELAYWLGQAPAAGYTLPCDNPQGSLQACHAATAHTRLDKALTRQLLQQAPAAYRTQVNDLLLTALTRVLARWTGTREVLIQLEGHGREELFDDIDLTRTVGWFTSLFPVKLSTMPELDRSIKQVKEQLRSIPNKGMGFGILRYLGEPSTQQLLASQAAARITFNYLGQFDASFTDEQSAQAGQGAMFRPAQENGGATQGAGVELSNWLSLNGRVYRGELSVDWSFSRDMFAPQTIQRLADAYAIELKVLIEHCLSAAAGGVTPSDFPLAHLQQQQLDNLPMPAREVEDIYPLSPMQQGMLFHSLYQQGGGDYINQMRVDVRGLDVDRFRRAWQAAVDRHEVLRASFVTQFEQPLQVIRKNMRLPFVSLDWCGRTGVQDSLDAWAHADRQAGFDLQGEPLLRVAVIRTEQDLHHVIYTSHHILMDGWSNSQLLGEVLQTYAGELGQPLTSRYRDYIQWLQRQDKQQSEDFWREQVKELENPTRLAQSMPVDKQVEAAGQGDHFQVWEARRTRELTDFARQQRATANTLVQCAWLLLLQRYTGQACVAFGATVSGRPTDLPGVEQQLGLFINTLPVIAAPQPSCTVAQWIEQVQIQNLRLREHEHSPLYEVQRLAGSGGEGLFDTLLVFENYPVSEALQQGTPGGLAFFATRTHEQTNYPLTLLIGLGETLTVHYRYDRRLFSEANIRQVAEHFGQLLGALIRQPHQYLGELSMLGASEHEQVVYQWNSTQAGYPAASLQALIQDQVVATPGAPALVVDQQVLTYDQLNRRANRLAWHLRQRGVGPDVRVGICMERSVEMVVGLLAIIKAGGAYVPLDPEYPVDRLRYMIEDSGIGLLLTQGHLVEQLPLDNTVDVLLPDDHALSEEHADDANLPIETHGDNLAYVIYTSGSTGRPKGAGNSHAALVNRLWWMQQAYMLDASDSVLQKTPFSFDVSVWEFFWPLMVGARLVMAGPGDHRDPARLAQLISEHRITTLHFVPSMLQAFVDSQPGAVACAPLRRVVCSGEAFSAELQRLAMAGLPGVSFHNLYGPTEAAIDVTFWRCVEDGRSSVPIGRPIANLATYVLDAELNALPAQVTGELYLGGAGLARGYHQRPGLTAERFVASPFQPGQRLYRTGDLARMREDGVIEYVGRIDHQVKIRGLRIELGEIEAVLLEQAAVREAVVVAIDTATGKQLVAYVVLGQADALEALKASLAGQLAAHMVPYHYVALDRMPLSPNGKLDRKRLPAPEFGAAAQAYVAPSSATEQRLVAIWQAVLHQERIGVNDNFFELGGDSIVSIQIASRSRQAGMEVSPKHVFEHQTIAQLAVAIDAQPGEVQAPRIVEPLIVAADQRALLPVAAADIVDVYPLSPMQKGMLYHSIEDSEQSLYINQVSLPVSGLDVDRFVRAWAAASSRHDVLRTSFHWLGLQEPLQVVHHHAPMPWRALDWRDEDCTEVAVQALAREEWARGFDLTQAPLHRLVVVRVGDQDYQLIWTSHHILLDGWSTSRLFAEVMQHYQGQPVVAAPGRYGEFIAWLHGQDRQQQEQFWRDSLANSEATSLSQAIHPRHESQQQGHHALYSRWDRQWTARMQDHCRRLRITPNTLIQGAWLLLLQRYTGQRNVTFGATVAGRPEGLAHADTTLGLFINTLPVSRTVDPLACLADWLRELQAYNLELRHWSHTPLNDVQRWAAKAGQALFDSIIVFENYPIDDSLRETADHELSFGASSGVGVTNFPMDLAVNLNDTLEIEYLYLRNRFDERTVEGIREVMEATLEAMLREPQARLGNLDCLPARQREAAAQWGAAPSNELRVMLLPDLIAEQARRQPGATALICGEQQLTYAQLEQRASELAQALRSHGARPERVVGVALERSVDLVVSLLAVMKAGAAYVPLDLEYPPQRLAWMIEDSGMELLITRPALGAVLPALDGVQVIEPEACAVPAALPLRAAGLDERNLAYLIYTSGSTGKPKGVAVSHGPLSRHCQAIVERYEMGPQTRELHFMSFAFDGAQERWLSTLSSGGTLVVRDGDIWTAEQTLDALWQYRISIACFPPAYLKQLAEVVEAGMRAAPPVDIYCFGGDAVSEQTFEQAKAALAPRCFTNGYGPTETVVTPLLWKVDASEHCQAAYAPIGHAVGLRSLQVVDDQLNPLAVGFTGELMIGGDGIARGYHARAALTAERFVPDPFGAEGARMYRSGDLVRRREEGVLDYVGRIDNQVKVRGFRIELGEIEACLRRQPTVRDALVIAREGISGKQLVGYVVGQEDARANDLKAALGASLPDYMVPTQIMVMACFPVTPNGKVDRNALPEPEFISSAFTAPRDERERLLAGIWAQVLQVDEVGITDNFFERGGDSILSLQVVSKVRNHPDLDLELKLRDLLRYQTIEAIVANADPAQASQVALTSTVERGWFSLLPIQEWMFAEGMEAPGHFNQALMLKPRAPLDLKALEQALICIERQHDALRLRFGRQGNRWMQCYHDETASPAPLLQCHDVADSEALMALANQAQRSLDLLQGPVWRALHVRLADGQARLLLIIHHLVVDGVSWRVLLDDLQVAYHAFAGAQVPRLPERTSTYRAWVERLTAQAADIAQQQGQWWLEQVRPVVQPFPCDNPRGRNEVSEQATARIHLTREQTAQLLKQAPAAYRTQVNDLLLTALARALCHWGLQDTALVQLEGHGREDLFEGIDLSRTLGWFTSMFPVRLAPGAHASVGESIVAVQRQLAAIPDKGLGYGVLRYLGEPALSQRLAESEQPRVTFNYFGQFDQSFDEQALLEPAPEGAGECFSPRARLANWLEIVGQVYDGALSLRCVYSQRRYRPETVQRLMDEYRLQLQGLIEHCVAVAR